FSFCFFGEIILSFRCFGSEVLILCVGCKLPSQSSNSLTAFDTLFFLFCFFFFFDKRPARFDILHTALLDTVGVGGWYAFTVIISLGYAVVVVLAVTMLVFETFFKPRKVDWTVKDFIAIAFPIAFRFCFCL